MAHSALFEHVKLRRWVQMLGIPRPHVIGYWECLCNYCVTHCWDGDLSRMTDTEIEMAAEWDGEAGMWLQTAIECRFIDRSDEGTVMHDWADWAPRHVKLRLVRKCAPLCATVPQRASCGTMCAREEKSREEKSKEDASASSPRTRKPSLGCSISWNPQDTWSGISQADLDEWTAAYPAVDIRRQLAAMTAWLKANPKKAAKRAWRRFITNWLARTQDRGGDARSVRPAADCDMDAAIAAGMRDAERRRR